jgi:hypothetical protein
MKKQKKFKYTIELGHDGEWAYAKFKEMPNWYCNGVTPMDSIQCLIDFIKHDYPELKKAKKKKNIHKSALPALKILESLFEERK